MHTYLKTPEGKWAVGIYTGSGSWRGVRTFDTETEAAAFCNYLSGGDGSYTDPNDTSQLRYFGEVPL
jgi:hypothetical protein